MPLEFIFVIEQVLNGLLVGTTYLLIALGLSLIFSLGGVVNLAHGAFFAIGAYLIVLFTDLIGYPLAFIVSPIVVALIGILVERFFFRPFYNADPALGLLLTFGLALVIEQVLRMIFGSAPTPFAIPSFLRGQLTVGSLLFSNYRFAILVVTFVIVVGLWFLLQRTPFGRIVRAGVQNPEMVGALGISLSPYLAAVAALGIGIAGVAGVMMAPISGVQPAMGMQILVPAFVVVVIGGLGSFWGVIIAALLVGVIRGLTVYFYPPAAEASMYLLMVLVLLLRPRGLFGERITRFE